MHLIKEIAKATIPNREHPEGISQEMLKGLCFNCDNRRTCTWKEDRKFHCEHFQ